MKDRTTTYLDVAAVRELLSELGDRLVSTGRRYEIAVYGGAALLLHFGDRPATRDVDVVAGSASEMEDLVRLADEIGAERGLSSGWLNDAVQMFVSPEPELGAFGDFPPVGPGGLRVCLASPRYILAMKLTAMRSTRDSHDPLDVWNLIDHCGITTPEEATRFVTRFFPGEELPERTKAIVLDLFEAKAAGRRYDPTMGW